MATPNSNRNFGDVLMSLPRIWLYGILIIVTSVPLFITIPIPNKTVKPSEDFFRIVNEEIQPGQTVLIASDWTNSTRAESKGHFKALMRVLMRRGVKFALYSTSDPQAPQAARDTVRQINEERKAANEEPYKRWDQWVSLGYFPNAEGTAFAIDNDFRALIKDKKELEPTSRQMRPVLESPVFEGIEGVQSFPYLFVITASKTSNITIERVKKTKLAMMVTGVMGPESQVYYESGQVKGLATGLKGVYDIENMMAAVPDWKDKTNFDNGAKYYPTLHFAMAVLIIAVIVGNVGMALSRKRGA